MGGSIGMKFCASGTVDGISPYVDITKVVSPDGGFRMPNQRGEAFSISDPTPCLEWRGQILLRATKPPSFLILVCGTDFSTRIRLDPRSLRNIAAILHRTRRLNWIHSYLTSVQFHAPCFLNLIACCWLGRMLGASRRSQLRSVCRRNWRNVDIICAWPGHLWQEDRCKWNQCPSQPNCIRH